jgi:hypothetical protein
LVGVIAFLAVLEVVLPPLAVIAIIVRAALTGRPRQAGRRAYAIAIVPLALAAVSTYRYFWWSADHYNNIGGWVVPPPILFIGAITFAAFVVGCLLGVVLYRPSSRTTQ